MSISNANNNNFNSFARKQHFSITSVNSCLRTLNMDKLFTSNSRDTRHQFCFIHKFMKLCFEILNSTLISLSVIYHFLRSEYNHDREAPKRISWTGRLQANTPPDLPFCRRLQEQVASWIFGFTYSMGSTNFLWGAVPTRHWKAKMMKNGLGIGLRNIHAVLVNMKKKKWIYFVPIKK